MSSRTSTSTRAWAAATESERRIPIEELVENVTVLPDHLEVTVSGAPRLHVLYQEVGLKESYFSRVGGPTGNRRPRRVIVESGWSELRRAA